jgi:hypothetical protein
MFGLFPTYLKVAAKTVNHGKSRGLRAFAECPQC